MVNAKGSSSKITITRKFFSLKDVAILQRKTTAEKKSSGEPETPEQAPRSPKTPQLLTRPPDLAAEYLQNHDSLADPNVVGYDHQQGQFATVDKAPNHPLLTEKPLSPSTDRRYAVAAVAQENFNTKILNNVNPEVINTGKSVRSPSASEDDMWEDVIATIRVAEEKYQNADKVRRSLRRIGDGASTIRQYMKLLPDSVFSSTLLGGLTIILEAAESVSSVREEVLGKLAEIPYRVEIIGRLGELYQLDPDGDNFSQKLHEKSAELYEALLDAITLMILWLNKKSTKKFLRAVFLGSEDYGSDIKSALSRIEGLAEDLWREGDLCLQKAVKMIGTAQRENHQELRRDIKDLKDGNQKLIHLLNSKLGMLRAQAKAAKQQKPLAARKSFKKILEDRLLCALQPVDGAGEVTSQKDYFRDALAANAYEKDRVNWVMKTVEFHAWLTSLSTQLLVINGNTDDTRISPLSFLCAFLVNSLDQAKISHGVFYCGDNTSDGLSGIDILRSLITQLVTKFDFNWDFLEEDIPTSEELRQPKCLGWILGKLLKQLEEGTIIFWIIDGLSWLESDETLRATEAAFKTLQSLIQKRRHVIFKLLVTYPTEQTYMSIQFGRSRYYDVKVLDVPEEIDGDMLDVYDEEDPASQIQAVVEPPKSQRRRSSWLGMW